MIKGQQLLRRLYRISLGMYPTQFRREFGKEMLTVFSEALAAARSDGPLAVLRLCGRELSDLPGALLREHIGSRGEEETSMEARYHLSTNQADTGLPASESKPASGWREIILAALPFMLILLIDSLPKLLVTLGLLTWESSALGTLNKAIAILAAAVLLAAFFVGWRQKWPLWTASWYLVFLLVPAALIQWLVNMLIEGGYSSFVISQAKYVYVVFPLIIAIVLYAMTRLDRVRGLLAVLPVTYILWWPNREFVADFIEVAILVASTLLICLAIAVLLRQEDWRVGLYAVLIANLAVGFLFSYGGIYYGGTLPFWADGPSLAEVVRSLVPQYLATCAILLGPLFAWKFRQEGRLAGRGGKTGYHLALAGLLVIILVNLYSLMIELEAPELSPPHVSETVLIVELLVGLGIYILGLILLYRAAQPVRAARAWAERLLLVILPLGLPLALLLPFIDWTVPMSRLYGYPQLWELPRALVLSLGMLWLVLSVWVITRQSGTPAPQVALGEAAEAPLTG